VAEPFGYLFPLISLGLAALGIMTGIGTLFGRWWARWLNAVLSGIVMYRGHAVLGTGLLSAACGIVDHSRLGSHRVAFGC
jgi:hypothetical protein